MGLCQELAFTADNGWLRQYNYRGDTARRGAAKLVQHANKAFIYSVASSGWGKTHRDFSFLQFHS